jgi:phenylalanyl-tRNA synthetase beta chain
MKLSLNWIKEYVDLPAELTLEKLAYDLTMATVEVEGWEDLKKNFDKIVVGNILELEKHPDADKLNVFEGAVVPAALDGAVLPTGLKIKTTPMRGVVSQGMFCSGSELMIDDNVIAGAEVDGILILPADAKKHLGADIKSYLGLDDCILDISITSNRPDCGSILGISREIAALLKKPLKPPSFKYKTVSKKHDTLFKVTNKSPALCPHYNLSVVENIILGESPKWMRDRLRMCGIRPINNFVDITNYVLLEIGEPMHAFDTALINGGEVIIRTAKEGESIVALDGKTYNLTGNMLLIADKKKPVAIAGVMGGEYSGVNADTKNIAFEAAKFAKGSVRQTSRALGLRSESSARFEKGVDGGTALLGMKRALSLVNELKIGTILDGIITSDHQSMTEREIEVSLNKVNGLLGIIVPPAEVKKILTGLGIKANITGDKLTCTVPLFRDDIENYADIAEEVIRIYGYEHILPTLPKTQTDGGRSEAQKKTLKTIQTLVGLGGFEAVTYSFVNKDCFDKLGLSETDSRRNVIELRNPLSEEFGVMRTTMAHSMLSALSLNQNRKNASVRLFEIAKVYLPKELPPVDVPLEPARLAVGLYGDKESFFTLKGILTEVLADFGVEGQYTKSKEPFLHTGVSADIIVDGKIIGYAGEVHPTVQKNYGMTQKSFIAELDFDILLSRKARQPRFKPLPRFPGIERDIALTVLDSVSAGDILRTIKSVAGSLMESVELFDVYSGSQVGEGAKSLAYRIVFRSPDRTLVETEITEIMTKLTTELGKKFSAKIRGVE